MRIILPLSRNNRKYLLQKGWPTLFIVHSLACFFDESSNFVYNSIILLLIGISMLILQHSLKLEINLRNYNW